MKDIKQLTGVALGYCTPVTEQGRGEMVISGRKEAAKKRAETDLLVPSALAHLGDGRRIEVRREAIRT